MPQFTRIRCTHTRCSGACTIGVLLCQMRHKQQERQDPEAVTKQLSIVQLARTLYGRLSGATIQFAYYSYCTFS
jgi:hypothetical protein